MYEFPLRNKNRKKNDIGSNFYWSISLSLSSLDQSEEEQEGFLKELPKRCLFLAYEDPYRRCVRLASVYNLLVGDGNVNPLALC